MHGGSFEAGRPPPEAASSCPTDSLAPLGGCSFGFSLGSQSLGHGRRGAGKTQGRAEGSCPVPSPSLSLFGIMQKSQWPDSGARELDPSWVQASSVSLSSEPLSAPDLLRGGWRGCSPGPWKLIINLRRVPQVAELVGPDGQGKFRGRGVMPNECVRVYFWKCDFARFPFFLF